MKKTFAIGKYSNGKLVIVSAHGGRVVSIHRPVVEVPVKAVASRLDESKEARRMLDIQKAKKLMADRKRVQKRITLIDRLVEIMKGGVMK